MSGAPDVNNLTFGENFNTYVNTLDEFIATKPPDATSPLDDGIQRAANFVQADPNNLAGAVLVILLLAETHPEIGMPIASQLFKALAPDLLGRMGVA